MAALVCNFPKPGAQPALMQHDEVVTFFHEFGHVLHHLLTQSELASFSGTSTVRDFVEAPSQMFEEWAWSREVLDLFAAHHKSGDKIPDALFNAMVASRSFGRALATQRQLFLAMLDLEYHSRGTPLNTTSVLKEVQNAFDSFPYVDGTHFQSSFGHLVGYEAGYYGYQWALSLSRDVLTRFKKEGLLNTATAQVWPMACPGCCSSHGGITNSCATSGIVDWVSFGSGSSICPPALLPPPRNNSAYRRFDLRGCLDTNTPSDWLDLPNPAPRRLLTPPDACLCP